MASLVASLPGSGALALSGVVPPHEVVPGVLSSNPVVLLNTLTLFRPVVIEVIDDLASGHDLEFN